MVRKPLLWKNRNEIAQPLLTSKIDKIMFKRLIIIPLFLLFGFFQNSYAAPTPSFEINGIPFLIAQNMNEDGEDSAPGEDDALSDEDEGGGDDVLDDSSEDDDMLADDDEEEDEDEENEDSDDEDEDRWVNRITFSSEYSLFAGKSYSDKADLANGNSVDSEAILENMYQFTGKLQTSEYSYYFLRLAASLRMTNNSENEQYKEGYQVKIKEGYYYEQDGKHRYKIGAQILKNGKVDYKSPIDVLSMSDQDAIDLLNLDDGKSPTFALVYDWLGKGYTASFLLAPLKMKTEGTEFTILKEEMEDDEADEDPENTTVLRGHFGARYQTDFGNLSTRFGFFRWFDRDNNISWKEQQVTATSSASSVDTDQDYQEEDTTISFLTGEFDWTLGNYVWKTDIGYFFRKNFYHYNKTSSETKEYTVQLKHLAVATSLERKFEKLFLMPTYTYYKIWDVSKNRHIIMFENEETPKDKKHDLYKHQVALIAGYEFTDNMSCSLTYATTTPFNMSELNFSLTWNPDGGPHEIAVKGYFSESEKIKMTDERIQKQVAFLSYNYKM